MLLNQMLTEMRKTATWSDGEEGEQDMFGGKALFESLDAEFSKVMSRAQGLGLSQQLMTAFDRMQGTTSEQGHTVPMSTGDVGDAGALLDPVAVGRQVLDGGDAVSETNGRVTSGFGWRRDPFTGEARFHKGVDLRAAYGQDVAAAAGGKVVFSGNQGSYGTTVVLEHANGTRSRYAHLSLALVAAGDEVTPGQLVGQAGQSGRATGPHVHLEVVDRNGRPLNPLAHPEIDR